MSPGLDAASLGERFARARRAALAAVLPPEAETEDEIAALRALPVGAAEELGRRTYWNAWRLGTSAARAHGAVNEADRLAALLGSLGVPCLAGEWRCEGDRRRLGRDGCAAESAGAAACDFYREAADGLVAGLSERLRFVRWTSRGHGAARCEDLLCSADDAGARFAAVPAEIAEHLARPRATLARVGLELDLLGLLENRLYVRLESASGSACGPTKLYFDLLAEHLAKRFPGLALVDATPRAVPA